MNLAIEIAKKLSSAATARAKKEDAPGTPAAVAAGEEEEGRGC